MKVPPFVTAHLGSDIKLFCAGYNYAEKADLSKGYQNPKKKLGVTTRVSEIIDLKWQTSFVF